MSRRMLVDAVHPEETRVVITDNKSSILEYDFATAAKPQIKGNVFLAKVTRVEPSLQAAFVEYGGGKQGFLPFSEIHPNYYQIPVEDREKLLQEEEDEAAQDVADDEEEDEENELDQAAQTIAELNAQEESVSSDDVDEEEPEKPKRRRGGRRRNAKKADAADTTETENKGEVEAEANANSEETESKASEDTNSDESTKASKAASDAPKAKAQTDEPAEGETDADADGEAKSENSDEAESNSENDNQDNTQRRRRRGGRNRGGRNNRRRGGRNNNDKSDSSSADVETISGEDEIERPRRSRDYLRRYKIQEVIKRNQVLLVQVIKEERGNKGVSLTSFLSLAGRYCVLMPNSPRGGGVSRKISSGEDRKRLKKILADMALPTGMSVIIRTAGAGRTRAEVKRDFDYLVKLWNQIREETLQSSAPALVYEESNIVQRTIRDSYNTDMDEILVEGEQAFKDTKAFMRKLIPSHAPKVKQYQGERPLFHNEGVDKQLASMMEPEVRLKSGGSIVMVPTEALISIDVNSGRSTRERNVEETALKTNLEAAREVARQLRLRDLAGLIVIDFIDMSEGRNRRSVERVMKEALRHDKAKIQVGRISSFGLMEMSRQRMRSSIAESINRACPHCNGVGVILSESAQAMQIIRAIEKEASDGSFDRFRVSVTAPEALYMLNSMRGEIDKIEENFKCEVEIVIDGTLHEGKFRIEKFRRKNDNSNKSEKPQKVDNNSDEKPSRNRRGGRGGRNRNKDDAAKTEQTPNADENTTTQTEAETDNEEQPKAEKPKRTRKPRVRKPKEDTSEVEIETTEVEAPKEAAKEAKKEEAPVEAEKPKRRGRPRKADKAETTETAEATEAKAESTAEPKLVKSDKPKAKAKKAEKATPEPKAEEPKAEKPKRKGWWQKIVD